MTTFTTFSPVQERGHYAQRVINWESLGPPVDSYHNDPTDYWCDTCDKGFRAAYLLEKHKQSHQKCNIDGCQFIAHPMVITKHIQMQHSTGLYNKICKLNEPEEIKKWREERKKKYPTKENIEKKAAQMKEKISRGEKMGICDRRNKKQYKSDHFASKKLKTSFKNTRNRMYDKRPEYKNKNNDNTTDKHKRLCNITLPPIEISRTLKPFGGIQHLILETDDMEQEVEITNKDLIEEDEYVPDVLNVLDETEKSSEIKVCGALTSLICNYGSSDEEDNIDTKDKKSIDLPENKNINNTVLNNTMEENTNKTNEPNGPNGNANALDPVLSSDVVNEVDDDSGPEESTIVKEHIDAQENNVKEQKISSKKHNKAKLLTNKAILKNNTYRRKLPSTLLEKLLHGEIKKERNIVLQCIRYIVKNNYFDTESVK